MPPPDKPRHRSGYTTEETEQVKAACLTVAVTLGAYLDDICIVGGLVPSLLIDLTRAGGGEDEDFHPGTNDLDIGLALGLLDGERYAEVSRRLRSEDFEPDVNSRGNRTVQTWLHRQLKVKIDFLIPPAPGDDLTLRLQNLEPDFGALVTPGLELAFDDRVYARLDGHTLRGERVIRDIPVCGPASFTVLKALAFGDRGEPKDAYDLVYVTRYAPGRGAAIAERLKAHADRHSEIVARALDLLARDFKTLNHTGPLRAAQFVNAHGIPLDDDVADAHGYVDDLLRAAANLGLIRSSR
jgi:hypothetical protein